MDAAIVRVMKARKEYSHALLVSEVIPLIQRLFNPTQAQIKKRIETLIEREYLMRKEGDRNTYIYLA